MTIVAEQYAFVTGVDTHARNHQFAIITSRGVLVGERSFSTNPAGIARATAWVASRTGGLPTLASIDGAGAYGRPLVDAFTRTGIPVIQAPQIRHRPEGKDDRIDARLAATSVLPLEEHSLTQPKTGPERDAAQILLTARGEMTRERTRAINALTGLLRRHPLGIDARRSLTSPQLQQISRWRARPTDPIDTAAARREATRLATRIRHLNTELATNHTALRTLMTRVAPRLLAEPGIGPVSAATIYAAWSHPGRIRSEAAFARLAGTAPKPASSGNHTRHRLDRGGDRQLNAALHRIVLTRSRAHPDTLTYIARRRTEGRTDRDIRRCLKRILTRHLYRLLKTGLTT